MYTTTFNPNEGLADNGIVPINSANIPLVGTPPGGWEAHQTRVQTNPYQGTPSGITTQQNDLVINKLLTDIRSGFTGLDNKFQEKEWSEFLEKNDIEQKLSLYGYSVSYRTLTWVSLIAIAFLTYLWLT